MDEFEESILKTEKIIIFGNTLVGKTCLLRRYIQGEYKQTRATIAIDFRTKKVNYQVIDLKLELWDSAGHDRYRTVVYNYFTFAKAAVIVFDLTNQDSLMHARDWLQQFVNHCGDEIPKILLGNKSDLLNSQEIQEKMFKYRMKILEMKQEFDFEFFVVSAKIGAGVEEAFSFLVGKIYAFSKRIQLTTTKDSVFKLNASILAQNKSTRGSLYNKKCC